MENDINENYKKDVLRFALFLGELMLSNGAETYRVEDSIIRICKSRGFKHINVFTSPTAIIISDNRFDGFTFMKIIKKRSINLHKISILNNISRDFVNNLDCDVEFSMDKLNNINNMTTYHPLTVDIATGLGSAFFACLLGGNNLTNFIFTFITSIIAITIYKSIMKISSIPAFSSLIASIFIATVGVLLASNNLLPTPKMLIVGSIMPLLPGVAFIKGIRDLISGDLISGVSRSFDAGVTAVSIACGVWVVLDLWFMAGGNL